ncbi:MAG: hypothetical protein ACREFZ_03925 [Acetobacteraceae bacterium]
MAIARLQDIFGDAHVGDAHNFGRLGRGEACSLSLWHWAASV